MYKQAMASYAQNYAAVTSPEKLIEMLYEGLLKFTNLAKRAIEKSDIEEKSKYINKSIDIFIYLIDTLKDDDSQMKAYLTGLYMHQIKSLTQANIKNSTKELDTVIHVVKVLLETWQEETSKMPKKGAELEVA